MPKQTKSDGYGRIVKASIWYTISNFLMHGTAFLTTPLFTRILSKADFGAFNNFLSWYSLISIITTFNLSSTISRARFDFKEDVPRYLSSILFLGSAITLFFYFVVLAGLDYFSALFNMEAKYLHLLFISLLFAPSIKVYLAYQRVHYRYIASSAVSVGNSLTTVAVSVLLVFTMKDKLEARIIGYLVPGLLFSLVIYVFLSYRGKGNNFAYWRYAFLICLPYLPHMIAGNVLGSSDRIMIMQYRGAEETALYSLAYQNGLFLSFVWTSMNQAFSPFIGEKLNEKDYGAIYRASRPYLLIFIIPSIFLMLIAPEILYILGGEQYMVASAVMPPVILSCIVQFVYSLYVNVEIFEKKLWGSSVATVISAALNVGLNIVFIPTYGYIAAAYTTLASYFCLLLIHFFLVKKMGLGHIFDNKLFFSFVSLAFVVSLLISYLYGHGLLRYTVTAIGGLACLYMVYKYRSVIIGTLKRGKG